MVVKIDSGKAEAVVKMSKPENVEDVRCLYGFVSYLSKFLPELLMYWSPLDNSLDQRQSETGHPLMTRLLRLYRSL